MIFDISEEQRRMKKVKMRAFIALLLFLTLFLNGCSDRSNAAEGPITYKFGSQEFEIYYYFQEYQSFIELAEEEKSKKHQRELLEEQVINPLIEDGMERIDAQAFVHSDSKLSELHITNRALLDNFNLINKSIKKALKESSKVLPSSEKTKIYVLPSSPEEKNSMKQVKFVSGYAKKSEIVLFIDPEFEEEDLKYTVAHEYHHTVYKSLPDSKDKTILDLSVLEGKADTFAKSLYPEVEVPWIEPLKDAEGAGAWKAFMEYKEDPAYLRSYLFIAGDRKAKIPKWSLYKIGNEIMDSYLEKHPETSIEEWTKMDAEELFEKGGLMPM